MVVTACHPPEAIVPKRIRARRHLVVPVDGSGVVRVRVSALEVGAGAPVAQEIAARIHGKAIVPLPLAIGRVLLRAAAPAARASAVRGAGAGGPRA